MRQSYKGEEMTVEELIQRLVELAQRGRGQWEVKVYGPANPDDREWGNLEINDVFCEDEKQEVVID